MKNYKTIQTTKNSNGTYTVGILTSKLALLKALITGKLNLVLSPLDAATLSAGLYTKIKKQYKPAAKKPALKVGE